MIVRESVSPSFIAAGEENLPVIAWNNIVTHDSVNVTSEDADFPKENLENPATHLKWKAAIVSPQGAETITVTVPEDDSTFPAVTGQVDYLAVAKHNFAGRLLTLSYADAGSPPATFNILTHTPADNAPIVFQFSTRLASTVRLTIGTIAEAEVAQCAVISAGRLLTLERSVKIDATFPPLLVGIKSNVVNGTSESGNFVGRLLRNLYAEADIQFSYFSNDWFKAEMVPFIASTKLAPFFLALTPDTWPEDVGYCWLIKDAVPQFEPITERFHLTLEMRAIVT